MKLVVSHKSKRDHYKDKCDVCIIWCLDARLSRLDDPENSLLIKFIRTFGFKNPDVIIIAGGAKDLADGKSESIYVANQILKSIKLHNPPLIVPVLHEDCGAYGDTIKGDYKTFLSVQNEKAKYRVEQALKTEDYKKEIRTFVADFDNGLWEVD